MSIAHAQRTVFCFLSLALAGCSGTDTGAGAKSAAFEVLDPGREHHGKSYSEWNAEWFKWMLELPLDERCRLPLDDSTGDHCDAAQTRDVFFIAGAFVDDNVVVERDQCAVPAGKPLLFPLMNTVGDNGGIPAEQRLSDDDNRASVVERVNAVQPQRLFASVDGVPIPNLERFKTEVVEFSYDVPAEPNFYSCLGSPGVTGRIEPSYAGGYYVMLAPLSAGTHQIRFGLDQPDDLWTMDITYYLTVE